MPDDLVILGAVLIMLMLVVLAVTWRARGSDPATLHQLTELRARLDTLTAGQRDVPRALAEGAAQQSRVLVDVRERLAALGESTKRLEEMGRAVAEVEELLKVPKLRGTLGEMWLEELLRQVFPAGLYEMQYPFASGERVDAVVKVGDRLVPIDAKFPLEACRRMLAADGAEAERERRAFRRALRERVDEIAEKYIRPAEGTYDFALMYVPAENVYYEAVVRDGEREDGVVGHALERRVMPVSPNTLYAYLAALVHGLRGLAVEQRAREILESLTGLEQQLGLLQRTHDLAGRHLDNATKQHDEAARQLRDLRHQLGRIAGVEGPGARVASAPAPAGDREP